MTANPHDTSIIQPGRLWRQPLAIVGVGAIMPDAPTAPAFWANITGGHYSIADVPKDRWDPGLYYDQDPRAPGKTYSRIGGWVRDFPWDPIGWRLPLPPKVSEQMDDGQKWAVAAAREAIIDAGWPGWNVDPERVAVVIGNAMGGEQHYATTTRIGLPEFIRELSLSAAFASLPASTRDAIVAQASQSFLSLFPDITEDTMPGELANIIAGRIANLFNFRGPSFTTDAACASGLAGLSTAAAGLADGQYDAVITGGVDRNMGAGVFVKFCKIGALSATGTRPFDAGADGFVMGEGAALFVLRRLADAERDGMRIYAVLLGVAGSSDGKGKGITAPNPAGQRLAIARAWRNAGADPATASCIEAHGTSTRAGDGAELESLSYVFRPGELAPGSIALGSVKSNIGHLKGAAGAAGLLKQVMALHEKVLPPSLNFGEPNPNVDWASSPFRVNGELREWPAPPGGVRRAGVSSFGFGGTNFHAVVEEYVPGRYAGEERRTFAGAGAVAGPARDRPAEAGRAKDPLRGALVVGGGSESQAAAQLARIRDLATAGQAPVTAPPDPALAAARVRVAIDFGGPAELADKAGMAVRALAGQSPQVRAMLRSRGVFIGHGPAPKTAFLYTGQGSQYVNMLRELRDTQPIVADTFAEADEVMTPLLGKPLTSYVFVDDGDQAELARAEGRLLRTEITQPAVLAADLALTRMLAAYGVRPDLVMGHSLGEYGALVVAGALPFAAALEAVSARGREMASISVPDTGAMAAVMAPLAEIERVVGSVDGYVVIANINSTHQAVIGGATDAVERAIEAFTAAGYTAARIPVSHAFHTAIVAPASEPLRRTLARLDLGAPALPVVANVDGEFYPASGAGVRDRMLDILGRQVASPVQFVKGLRTLYEAGARVFVEVGPKRALAGFADDVLGSEHDDVLALFTNHPKYGDIASFNAALCGLYAAGLGYAARPWPAHEPARAAPHTVSLTAPGAAMSEDNYAELGRLVADLIERGRGILAGAAQPGGSVRAAGPGTAPLPAPSAPDGAAPPRSEPVVITGAALGLPGTDRVFDDENVARILSGQQFIDVIPRQVRRGMADKRITRLVKTDTGDPVFETIESEGDVIKLAGRYGAFDLPGEFGVDADRDAALDQCTRLAIGAGLDALRDAGIPLVLRYRTTTVGTRLPDRWWLPEDMRDDTAVIFASAFPGYGSLVTDLNRYHEDRARRHELSVLEDIRARMSAQDQAAGEVDRRVAELRHRLQAEPFTFDRRFLFRILSMGHSQFAELIGARGPNTQLNAACASTAQALSVAEDWIRSGRCRRVLVVSADDVASDTLLPWTGSGFLATGAAATDAVVEDAALPFDRRRHGMIIGSGAAALIVESADAARERGIRPICEIVATATANSAFHGTRLDVEHISQVMEQLIRQAERRGVDRGQIAGQMVFISHETYTPARGGSASAEVRALRASFGPAADSIVVANTKGFTGHAMGAGIEEAVAVKALETGIVPPVPNFREPDPELGRLNLSRGGTYPVTYALRLAAGFGSQISMALLRWIEPPDGAHRAPNDLGFAYRIADERAWRTWLARVTGRDNARLEVVQRRLRVADEPARDAPVTAPTAETAEQTAEQTAPAVETAPAAGTTAAQAPEPIAEAVLDVVESLTGYPRDLLDLDLDLEADLGVDTVKQAEVFAAVRERFAIPRQDSLKLRDFPTLAHVIGFVRDHAPQDQAAQAALRAEPAFAGDVAAARRLPRRIPVPVLRPPAQWCKPTPVTLEQASRVIVMADEGGVAKPLVRRLGSLGVSALVIEPGCPAADLDSRLTAWLADGPVRGLYWLPALDAEPALSELDLAGWREALRRRVKNLYAVVRRLDQAGQLGPLGTFLVAGTRMGGYHGYDDHGATAPLGGAVTGFVKAYWRERPDVLAKAVDFQDTRKTAALADALIEETLRDPGAAEIGRAGERRWTVGLREIPFGDGGGMNLGGQTVFAVTGAAGAIVSAIIADLAKASGGVFHLLDLTPEPDPADPDLIQYATDPDGLKKTIAGRLSAAGTRPTPVLIERELARCERLHSALIAIQGVRAAGGQAHYHAVDLTDPGAVASVMADIRDRHGRVDVLVHAAGLDISHAIADKEPREFDLVFDVKSDGLFNLLHAADGMPVGAVVAFSSVAGRFGNRGQTDYSAANDLQCKIMSSFRTTRPGTRGIAVDWTAWGGLGMATRGSIPKVMAMAGIEMLAPEAGIAWVGQELAAGPFSGEVVAGGELGVLTAERDITGGLDCRAIEAGPASPMIGTITGMGVYTGLRAETTLEPAAQPFLRDHRIDGTAVLPGVMGIEAFAALASLAAPGMRVADVEQVDFIAPLKFYRDEPRTVIVTAVTRPEGADLVADCTLSASRTLAGEQAPRVTSHFTGRVRLTAADREQARERARTPGAPAAPAVSHDDIYHVFFHGPAYQVVDEAWHSGSDAVARLARHMPAGHTPQTRHTATEPRLAEACFQAAGLWEIGHAGHLALPAHVDLVSMPHRPVPDAQLFAVAHPAADGSFDCQVLDPEGDVVLRVDGYRTVCLDSPLPAGLRQPISEAMSALGTIERRAEEAT